MSLRIDAEFRSLIPPLREEERAQLEENLAANGCRDPLVLWRGILIDGHNRHEICERLKIKYRTVEIVLASRAHVLLWIEENQLGRRNLTDDQRSAIALAVKKRRAAMAEVEKKARAREVGKQGGRGKKKTHGDTVSPRVSERTRPAVAREARVPERKLRAVAEVEKKAGPEAVERIRAGMTAVKDGEWGQFKGIDRVVALDCGKVLKIDEKVRGKDYGDFCLERYHDRDRQIPGWIQKNLEMDYLAYAFIPSRRCYLLPFQDLRRAWRRHGREWIARYPHVPGENPHYITECIAVPIPVVLGAISTGMLFHFPKEDNCRKDRV